MTGITGVAMVVAVAAGVSVRAAALPAPHGPHTVAGHHALPDQATSRTAATANQTNDEWCADARRNNGRDRDREIFCEVREFTLPGRAVSAETSNGSIRVTGEQRGDILVRAMVVARAGSESAAREIARAVQVSQSGTIKASGPRTDRDESWWVSFRIQTPDAGDINLTSSNGSLVVSDVRGQMRLRTSNGSIRLMDVGGDVRADTSNGSVTASLSGSSWTGTGLDVQTSNGSVRLDLPANYNARLVASTSNGSINLGFPVTVQGRIGRNIDTALGSGGPTLRLRTSNGSVKVENK